MAFLTQRDVGLKRSLKLSRLAIRIQSITRRLKDHLTYSTRDLLQLIVHIPHSAWWQPQFLSIPTRDLFPLQSFSRNANEKKSQENVLPLKIFSRSGLNIRLSRPWSRFFFLLLLFSRPAFPLIFHFVYILAFDVKKAFCRCRQASELPIVAINGRKSWIAIDNSRTPSNDDRDDGHARVIRSECFIHECRGKIAARWGKLVMSNKNGNKISARWYFTHSSGQQEKHEARAKRAHREIVCCEEKNFRIIKWKT